jgi:hypothetical protein
MVIVRLNDWDEFLAELGAHTPTDRVVRLTFSIRYDTRSVGYVTMVAGYLDDGTIVEFVHDLGLQPADPKGERARDLKALFDDRKKRLEDHGYVVKPGRYHVPPATGR